MTKKQLYIVIAGLCVVLLYVLFMPVAVTHEEKNEDVAQEELVEEQEVSITDVAPAMEQEENAVLSVTEKVVLEGTFVGLLEDEDKYGKMFHYMLLDDDVEVLRIDLRPLIGNSNIDIIEKLGVGRGDWVTITGVMDESEFVVERIE